MKTKTLWGAALSAGQCEGAFMEDGAGASLFDGRAPGRGRCVQEPQKIDPNQFYPSHIASDFYHRYPSDIELFRELGIQCLRTSISWTRVFPHGDDDKPNEKALLHYDDMIDRLLAAGIEPIITISHLETPYDLIMKYGGWTNRAVSDAYVRFAETLFRRYKGKVKYWIAFNEMNMALHLPLGIGVNAKKEKCDDTGKYQALHHMFVSCAKAVQLCHSIDPDAQIGSMIAYSPIYPYSCKPEDVYRAEMLERENLFPADVVVRGDYPNYTEAFFKERNIHIEIRPGDLELLRDNTVDFIATSYYCTNAASSDEQEQKSSGNLFGGVRNPHLRATAWGWQIDPLGIYLCVSRLYERYQIPVMVVENGIGEHDTLEDGKINDTYRIEYISEHIKWLEKAIDEGVKVLAYTVWTALDVVSASSGEMEKRYGLIYVDRNNTGEGTLERIPKASYYWYQDFLKSH